MVTVAARWIVVNGRRQSQILKEQKKANLAHEFDKMQELKEKVKVAVEHLDVNATLISWGESSSKWNGLYKHSDFMDGVGDTTPEYRKLREKIDAILPDDDLQRLLSVAKTLRQRDYISKAPEEVSYDINDCPEIPPDGYPYAWNVLRVLDNWPPDDPAPRPSVFQGICRFDYLTERHKAINYLRKEVPFVIRDDPKVLRTVERWNHPGYMQELLGPKKYRTEHSLNNHFMYFVNPRGKIKKKQLRRMNRGRKEIVAPEGWEPPTDLTRMTYDTWLSHANVTDDKLGPDNEHWYYRLIGCGKMGRCDMDSSEYLFDELSFFQPRFENELYMVDPTKQKGIHCRFGMKGVIAENHFDGSRNMIAILGGERRYILSHPDECKRLCLYPQGHPSGRHSAVDWSDPDLEKFPKFKMAKVNEVIMQAGDVLYLPTNWFHYIISLELNFQCNTRSGISKDYMEQIHNCGF
eukprot:CAMPEP_0184870590 /NCGR_PEP_ID=MMETSP0580-20130426/38036_1 /TAXON_ID=1118495 /ORGANISM="Dactyliosolen fragilissimus" /LENGTH=463 /DNA_ID=CAMNT_0027372745 /DNA_START=350 /DNA_END=1741 /DNA_ORIENTATION=+